MGKFPQSFEVYGFTIEIHAGGRRVWPPSFKRFIKEKLDRGELTVGHIMKTCNVSQSLVYKWRADVKHTARTRQTSRFEERVFSEVVVEEREHGGNAEPDREQIIVRFKDVDLALPTAYPVDDLVKIILAIEARA